MQNKTKIKLCSCVCLEITFNFFDIKKELF